MRSSLGEEHPGEPEEEPSNAETTPHGFARGTLKITTRRRSLVQTLLPASIVLVALGVMLPVCAWIAAPLGRGSGVRATSRWASVPAALWVICAFTVMVLVVHSVVVRRQRKHAVELATGVWKVQRSRRGLADLVSLVFAFAGHTPGHIATAWPLLGVLRERLEELSDQHRLGALPRVWVIDRAPTAGLRRFLESDRAVLKSLVSVGWYQYGAGAIPRIFTALFLIVTALAPALLSAPWTVNRVTLLVGGGMGLALGFVAKIVYLKFSWRLIRVRGSTFLVRRRVLGGLQRRGPLERADPVWIVSPIDALPRSLQPFETVMSGSRSDLYLRCEGLPMITTMISEDDIVEYVLTDDEAD